MSRKKISTTIYVTPEQNDRLRLLHERTKVPIAVYIREGIDLVLRQYAHVLPGQLALDRAAPSEATSGAPSAPVGAAASPLRQDRAPALAVDAGPDRIVGSAGGKR